MTKSRISLTGAWLVMVLAVSACANTATQRTAGQGVDDSVLTGRVKSALIQSPATKAHDIDVEVYKGDVQLNGFVASADQKSSATEVVRKVAGVNSVRNNLQVQTERRSGGDVVDDAMITAKVKAALIGDSRTKAHQIEVTTNQGVVQLGGFVDSANAKATATDIARSIEGVKSVSNDLQLRD
jgi:hyperosmotically inducible protein